MMHRTAAQLAEEGYEEVEISEHESEAIKLAQEHVITAEHAIQLAFETSSRRRQAYWHAVGQLAKTKTGDQLHLMNITAHEPKARLFVKRLKLDPVQES